jgi:hypothetical protein
LSYLTPLGLNLPSAPNSSAIVDSTGGTASNTYTVAAITAGGSYAQADLVAVKNGLSTLIVLVNSLRSELLQNGLIRGGP